MKTFILTVVSGFVFATHVSLAAPLKAFYEVPTSRADLVNSNSFKIDVVSINTDIAGVTNLTFTFPEELTGVANEVTFAGQLNESGGMLQSEHGILNCLMTAKKLMCSASYQQVHFDNDLARQKMNEKFKDEELVRRLSVQEKFSTDPIGIIHVFKAAPAKSRR